ncbi:hypothetical protein AVEN_76680-1 [Araneus ventricosus]|uniref:Uncharacterized protein n=1 Tax=Araneus ventricosus TaxID=182803 RepID=A0A4Y2BQN0_ARAVE|nr:hypothetical protein AVEN_76680-1 [Araneus ventricosus]
MRLGSVFDHPLFGWSNYDGNKSSTTVLERRNRALGAELFHLFALEKLTKEKKLFFPLPHFLGGPNCLLFKGTHLPLESCRSNQWECTLLQFQGRGGLVVRFRGRRVPDLKLDSTEDPPCMWACCRLNNTQSAKRPPAVVERKFWRGGCQLRCRPNHLTAVQNVEVCPKIVLVLLQSDTLV